MFIFDTNFLIYFFKGDKKVVDFMFENQDSVFYIPTVVIVEFLSFPALNKSTEIQFENFVDDFIIVNLNREIAELAGEYRRKYKLKIADAIIAASAFYTNATLLTYDIEDFREVDIIQILSP